MRLGPLRSPAKVIRWMLAHETVHYMVWGGPQQGYRPPHVVVTDCSPHTGGTRLTWVQVGFRPSHEEIAL